MREISFGAVAAGDFVMALTGYFDDSADGKRERFASIGGLVGYPNQWVKFDGLWGEAVAKLREPFHATDCESGAGCCRRWRKPRRFSLMDRLTEIIVDCGLGAYGSVVPIKEYRAVFQNSKKFDPYFLALKHTIINMVYYCEWSAKSGNDDSIHIHHEQGDTTVEAFKIYDSFKKLNGWEASKHLRGFAVGDKTVMGLQGADLVAREAFRLADNTGGGDMRATTRRLQAQAAIHIWTKECLEYLRDNGGPKNLSLLTTWGRDGKPVPNMRRFSASNDGIP